MSWAGLITFHVAEDDELLIVWECSTLHHTRLMKGVYLPLLLGRQEAVGLKGPASL